ncbi:hypothetical protein [Granulicella sp. S190]|uniref:hypothetical protein n=1 Tax=Granulicella sp. S190 TaxID=1747226 RepID=UPI00131AB5A3|nr:hypothetical protein [Granulicella sp. S190]
MSFQKSLKSARSRSKVIAGSAQTDGLLSNRRQIHRTPQAEDHVFEDQHGGLQIAKLQPIQPGQFIAGLRAEIIAAVDPTANPAPTRMGRPGMEGAGMPPSPRS